jgi:DNA-binding response OmpR family regulator
VQTKILVVEDDNDINRILRRYLERERYEVTSAYSGTEAKLLLSMGSFELIILDLMLPGITGEELIGEIRKSSQTPILVISARIALEDKVKALKNGADDYMTKPFEREEVLARVEALLRRSRQPGYGGGAGQTSKDYSFKNLVLKPVSREVTVCGKAITLTAYEFDLLHLLLQYPDRVFTKEQLYQDVWKNGYYGEDNTINVHVSNIRKKIKEYDEASYIKTVWGIGFKIDNA